MKPDLLRTLAEQLTLFGAAGDASPASLAPLAPSTPSPLVIPAAPSMPTRPANDGHLQLGNRLVPYTLRRRARARLALVIAEQGLRINAPRSLPWREIEAFAHQHGAWVLRKLDEQAAAPRPAATRIADGTRLPVLGGEIVVRVLPGHNRTRWIGDTLLLEARADHALPALTRRGLQQRALTHFQARLAQHAPAMGLAPPPLGLSSARTRWGSCSSLSGIRLNWRLIHLAPELGDYVVVHELAHLYEMNHSPRFWAVVERQYPQWRAARAALRAAARTLPVI